MSRSGAKTSAHSSSGSLVVDDDGASVVVQGEDLERQFGSGPRKWCEAPFVDDERVQPSQLLLETEPPSFIPDLHQFVDQTRGPRGHSP